MLYEFVGRMGGGGGLVFVMFVAKGFLCLLLVGGHGK